MKIFCKNKDFQSNFVKCTYGKSQKYSKETLLVYLTLYFILYLGKNCSSIADPQFGSVQLPCVRKFGFSCSKKCAKGYYINGDDVAKCVMNGNQTTWTGSDTHCKGN